MSSELYQQRMFDQSSISSGLPEPKLQPYLFSASPFPPVAPDNSTVKNSAHAFQPFLRDQIQDSQYESTDTSSSHMEEDSEYIVSTPHGDESGERGNGTVSPMAPLFGAHGMNSNEPSLDERNGSSTTEMYLRMREVQLNHLPKYQPNSPYIKYRRYVIILFILYFNGFFFSIFVYLKIQTLIVYFVVLFFFNLHRYLVDWLAETSEELRFKTSTVHVAASFLDRVLIKANDTSSGGRCSIPKHLWQLVAMVCLRIAGKFEEKEEDVTGDGNGMLTLANGKYISAVEAFTRHLGDAAMMVTSSQVSII